jgi:hypothetical protein
MTKSERATATQARDAFMATCEAYVAAFDARAAALYAYYAANDVYNGALTDLHRLHELRPTHYSR